MNHARDERIDVLRQRRRARGLVPTPQLLAILRAAFDAEDHPSAHEVHAAVARRRVRVSRAAVLRTLEAVARLDALPVPDTRRFGFALSDFRVQLRGTCRECREQEEKR